MMQTTDSVSVVLVKHIHNPGLAAGTSSLRLFIFEFNAGLPELHIKALRINESAILTAS